MTQNLDLESNRTYTHWDTDLGWSTDNNSAIDEDATWRPSHSTVHFSGAIVPDWTSNNINPSSANPGDVYYYTSNSNADDIKYNSLQECTVAGHNDCTHYHAGNYYNWSAAVASNDTKEAIDRTMSNSICTKGWNLPNNNEYSLLFNAIKTQEHNYNAFGLMVNPLYFVRSGNIVGNGQLRYSSSYGFYWSSTVFDETHAYFLYFNKTYVLPAVGATDYYSKYNSFPIRCLAR